MDKLKQCAVAFNNLLNIEYKIIIGRKGIPQKINLAFDSTEFFHLVGLHKLTDLPMHRQRKISVFNDILTDKITLASISISPHFDEMESRLTPFINIENLLDSNEVIFQYNEHLNRFRVQGEYLLSNPLDNNDIYIFLDKDKNKENYFCRTFFPKNSIDYTFRQSRYTLLYKEKINKLDNTTIVQYDKLSKKVSDTRGDSGNP